MISRFSFCTLSVFVLFSVNVSAKVVTEKTAENVAKDFLSSKGLSQRELVLDRELTDRSVFRAQSPEAPAYHIFCDKEHNNYVVVSGDDIARPILGYSFGHADKGENDLPPAMKVWLNEMERQITYARKNGLTQSREIARQWLDAEIGNVVRQMETAQWNQYYPYNLECPIKDEFDRCITGCVATAYAILMKYYGYPSAGKGITRAYTCPTSGVNVLPRDLNHSYDWDNMPLKYEYGKYTDEQKANVARLMADIGAAIQSDYSPTGTSTYYNSVNKGGLFYHFGYYVGRQYFKSNYTIEEWYSRLKSELDDHPVLYRGEAEDGTGGHAFIIDGYTDNDYFFINWGWGGDRNGAYVLDALNLDFTELNSVQGAFFDFKPAVSLPGVVMVKDVECPSLEIAIGLAPANGQQTLITILKKDTVNEVYVNENQNIILDLNGDTIVIENYGIYNRGTLTITDSKETGTMIIGKGNTAILNNFKMMTVDGGSFINEVDIEGEETDYRRCLWCEEGSTTVINDGSFKCLGQVICSKGKVNIDGGLFECTGNSDVILNFAKTDTLTINNGKFWNLTKKQEGSNYRRAVWTDKESRTQIKGGQFSSNLSVICINGNLTVDGGTFESKGNSAVISNYATTDTLIINGGTIINSSTVKESSDYRRAVWATQESTTIINGGDFKSDYQVLTFNGKGTINGGTIENTGSGIGCLSVGNVIINDCKIKASRILAVNSGFSLKCYGGLYSQGVGQSLLGSGCKCVSNTDPATSSKYPYKVVNSSGVIEVMPESGANDLHYDLNGIIRSDNGPGLHIIRKPDGKSVKVIIR